MDYDYVFDLILFDGLKILLFILILFFVILILVIDPYLPPVVCFWGKVSSTTYGGESGYNFFCDVD